MPLFTPKAYLEKWLFFCLSGFFLLCMMSNQAFAEQVKVGVYSNKPLVFQDEEGTFQGFTIDVLRYVARQEEWDLQFVQGTWPECLERLEKGETDLQVAIAVSDERKKIFSYPEQTLITNWGRLYRYRGSTAESLLDLGGKTVAFLEKDIHAKVFFNLMQKFGMDVKSVSLSSYDEVLEQVEAAKVDVGIVNRIYAMQNAHRFQVETTPMIFNPIEVRFAAPKEKSLHLLQAIDHHLEDLRAKKDSIYYHSLEKWFGERSSAIIPAWIKPILLFVGGLLVLVISISIFLKRQVTVRTAELKKVNHRLTDQICQLQRTEDALAKSEKQFKAFFNNANDAIFVHSLRHNGFSRFVAVNDIACQHYGYSREEFLQLSVLDINKKYETKEYSVSELRSRLLETGHLVFETLHVTKSGKKIPVEINTNIIKMEGNQPLVLSIVRDLSERKLAEQEVRRSEKMLRQIIDIVPSMIFVKNAEGRFLIVNKMIAESCDMAVEDVVGKLHTEIHPDRDKVKKMLADDRDAIENGRTVNIPKESYLDPQGNTRWLQTIKVPCPATVFGEPAIVGIAIDITDRILAEDEKNKLEQQIRRSQKMESMGLMAGGVAHDLNNILSGIIGYPELMLLNLPHDSDLRKPLEAIQESGQRAAMVVADLLTIARGSASTREVADINGMAQAYMDSPECEKLKALHPLVEYQCQLSAAHSNIVCSPVHIKKCVMNLVTNAAEAIVGSGEIVVATHNQYIDEAVTIGQKIEVGEYVVLSVDDTGPGIAEKDLEHIFEPFYSKKIMGRSGTGLGLAVVWNTMEDHGGKIVVESSDKGTRFQLYFPVIKETGDVHLENGETEIFTGSGEHILVVDDEQQLRDIASQMLGTLGYKVDSVSSGELALEFLKENPVDLIVMDMLMEPGMSGRQTYEEMLKLYPKQKAIIVSGFSESEDVKAALQLGAGGFIKKPYSAIQLGQAVKEALGG
jgi:PAS domain S-box-containing protein